MIISSKEQKVLRPLREVINLSIMKGGRGTRKSSYNKLLMSINCVLSNIAMAVTRGNYEFIVVLHRKYYVNEITNGRKSKSKVSALYVKKVLDHLCNEYDCELEVGGKMKQVGFYPKSFTQSTFHISDELFDIVRGLIPSKKSISQLADTVQLKDRDKNLMSYKMTDTIRNTIANVMDYNKLAMNTDIRNEAIGDGNLRLQVKRVYSNGTMEQGGRWFMEGESIQSLSSELRGLTIVNGEKVTELDYVSFNASVVAELKGIDLGSHDAYGAQIEGYDPIMLRRIMKLACIIAFNTASFGKAVLALNLKITTKYHEELLHQSNCTPSAKFNAKEVMTAMVAHNHMLADDMFQEKGLYLQNLESTMMDLTLRRFTDMGELAIPVHDSIVTFDRLKEIGEQILIDSYREVLGSTMNCKIN